MILELSFRLQGREKEVIVLSAVRSNAQAAGASPQCHLSATIVG
jgi:hypothetical protein